MNDEARWAFGTSTIIVDCADRALHRLANRLESVWGSRGDSVPVEALVHALTAQRQGAHASMC